MNRDECIRAIVFARQKLPQLELVQLMNQALVFGDDFFLRLRSMCWIVFFCSQILQCAKIFDLAFQFLERIDQRAQSGNFLNINLCALPTGPKIRRSHARLDRTELLLKLLDVKETSAIRERAISDLQHLEWRFPLA
jgi:hypothetical protein